MKIRCTCGAEVEVPDDQATAKTICAHCGQVFAALETEQLRRRLEELAAKPARHYAWIGLAPDASPADFYALLGVRPWEEREGTIANALNHRLRQLDHFLKSPDTHTGAERLRHEVEHAAAVLCDTGRRPIYVAEERRRRGRIVEAWIDQAIKQGPPSEAAIKQLCRRTEQLALHRSLCLQLLRGRRVDTAPSAARSGRAIKTLLLVLLCLAGLGALACWLWRVGWFALGLIPVS